MTDSPAAATEGTLASPLSSLPGMPDLLPEDAAGWCAGGVCQIPAHKAEQAEAE